MFVRACLRVMKLINFTQEFSTGSIRHLILATEQPLGDLVFLRIWHDNSGKGDDASWFLDKVVVEDLQTKYK